jgi:hypothetical protein
MMVADPLLALHRIGFNASLLMSVLLAGWGLFTFFARRPLSGGYRSTLYLAEGLFVVQGILGLVLLATAHHLRDPLHLLYGVLLVIAIPIGAGYGGGWEGRRQALVFGILGVIMAALSVRALMTS